MVFPDVVLHAKRGIDAAVRVHKRELFQLVEPLHSGLPGLEVRGVGQIRLIHQLQRDIHILNIRAQIGGNNLFSAPRQLLKIEIADGMYRRLRALAGAAPHPNRSENEDKRDDDSPNRSEKKGVSAF